MNYITLLIKRNVMLVLTSVSVLFCFFSVFQISKALSIANDPLILAIDSNGTRVVRRQDDPIFETEAISFLKFYLKNLYNFTPDDFLRNVGIATSYMSISLWEEEKTKILSQHKQIMENQVSMVSDVRKIFKVSDNEFSSLIVIDEKSRLSTSKRILKLKLLLKKIPRSDLNPYGIEVEGYQDEEIK